MKLSLRPAYLRPRTKSLSGAVTSRHNCRRCARLRWRCHQGSASASRRACDTSAASHDDRRARGYGFPALLPGEYEVNVEAAGFQRIARAATVQAGTTTRADMVLPSRKPHRFGDGGGCLSADPLRLGFRERADHSRTTPGAALERPQLSGARRARTGRASSNSCQSQ